MSNWKRWPDPLNNSFANNEPGRIVFPDLDDGSRLVLASDYSGEHALPEFRVLSFLLTTYKSIEAWDPLRLAVRKKHLTEQRRMSFKDLNDALRVNAFSSFLAAASHLNGVLLCVGVEKGFSFPKDNLPPWQHDWTSDTLNKLLEICKFGGVLIDGLRAAGQNIHWITDDDSIVSTEAAQADAMHLMAGLLHRYPGEHPQFRMGITSKFDDDRRAEDLVAIADLAAGAFSETLTAIGKENIPRSGSELNDSWRFTQIKSTLITAWRSDNDKPLKHMNAVIRAAGDGQTLVSFGNPVARRLRPGESAEGAHMLNSKWRRALEADLKARGIDPREVIKSMGIDN